MYKQLYHFTNTKFENIDLDKTIHPSSHVNSNLGLWCFTELIMTDEYADMRKRWMNDYKHLLRIELKSKINWCLNDIADWSKYCHKNENAADYLKFRDFLISKNQSIFAPMESNAECVTACLVNLDAVRVTHWIK